MDNLQIKYRVVRMEVCDYIHKCKSASGCSSESTNDLGTIEREGLRHPSFIVVAITCACDRIRLCVEEGDRELPDVQLRKWL